jgi:hypothetical protein
MPPGRSSPHRRTVLANSPKNSWLDADGSYYSSHPAGACRPLVLELRSPMKPYGEEFNLF